MPAAMKIWCGGGMPDLVGASSFPAKTAMVKMIMKAKALAEYARAFAFRIAGLDKENRFGFSRGLTLRSPAVAWLTGNEGDPPVPGFQAYAPIFMMTIYSRMITATSAQQSTNPQMSSLVGFQNSH